MLQKKMIQIYLNPTDSEVQLFFDKMDLKNGGQLKIYTVDGVVVFDEKVFLDTVNVDARDFSKGIYMMILEVGEERQFGKLVKKINI
jgi:hypothetical protein